MGIEQNVLRLVPTAHSIALVKHNLKKRKKKKIASLAFDNIVGTSLIKAESEFINTI